jgi:hypothetical protein
MSQATPLNNLFSCCMIIWKLLHAQHGPKLCSRAYQRRLGPRQCRRIERLALDYEHQDAVINYAFTYPEFQRALVTSF